MSTGWMADAWISPPHTRIARAGLVVVALLRAELQAAAAYRAQLILGIFGWVVPLAFMVLWTGAAGREGVQQIGAGQFTTYFAVVLVTTNISFTAPLVYGLSRLVHSGELSARLLRPHHPLLSIIARGISQVLYSLLPMGIIVPAIVVLGDGALTDRSDQLILAPFIGIVGLVGAGYIAALVATLAFWMTKASGAQSLLYGLEWIAGGVIGPVLLLPGNLPDILRHQPLWYAVGAPAEMVSGISDLGMGVVFEAFAWVVALHVVFGGVWRRGLRRYEAVGT